MRTSQPLGREIHVIADNLSAPKTKLVDDFLANHHIAMEKSIQPSRPMVLSTNLTALGKHVFGNQANGQCDQSRNNDQIIQMSQDGDKIWN